jgi:NADH-dependent peroxiredoxin subunit F
MEHQVPMKDLLDEATRTEVKAILADLPDAVRLIFFTQKHACRSCREQAVIVKEVAALSEKISLETYDAASDTALKHEYGIDKIPATAVVGRKDYGIRFFGVTAGYEFSSLLNAIFLASHGTAGLPQDVEEILKLIDQPAHLEVMVSLTCPYCFEMVHLAHQMAVANEHIRADMVDLAEYPHLAQRYRVSSVPWTIINETPAFQGALPALNAALEVLRAVRPREYERIDAKLRQARGERRISQPREDAQYDVIIVGAGPAAYSAAIYATRKGLAVLLLGDSPGGQINDTANIENWLGIPSITGQNLSLQLQNHIERYDMAQELHVAVTAVKSAEKEFQVVTADGTTFRGRSVIYCAGKQYRRLGVPGEQRFLGKGIAFCATCDAPLFRDRSVAIIGGGNSAFTAARDLLYYAKEIHIVNVMKDFQADAVLIDALRAAPQVTMHPVTQVVSFLGEDRLTGVRLESVDGLTRLDLAVDGVFLEIGLMPNSAPVQGLVPLNEAGEIAVNRDQSTAVPGFFAAGDVTDEAEKQIVIAAGAGARAALSAHRYLFQGQSPVSTAS